MKTLLLVDDDKTFCQVLQDALHKRGFDVLSAHRVDEALTIAGHFQPEYVLVDLKIPAGSGLSLIPQLLEIDPHTKIVVLTGFASIATAIEAIKLGAVHYLSKPVTIEEMIEAFDKEHGNPDTPIEPGKKTLNKLEREHIEAVLERNQHNISLSARELGMHRRTLQRKLEKKVK